jgi:hypothetical protein
MICKNDMNPTPHQPVDFFNLIVRRKKESEKIGSNKPLPDHG